MGLIEAVVSAPNMRRAYKRVVSNGGAPGVDSVSTDELADWLNTRWEVIKEQLRRGRYRPAPVRVVEIPKPGGGRRMLGIPTVADRLIQQALLQILSPVFDPGFSSRSYGFCPGRSAGQACGRPARISSRVDVGSWISIWRSFSTGSTTTCLWHGWLGRSKTKQFYDWYASICRQE